MKKVILLFLITAVMFSCKKNEPTQPAEQFAEVTFNVTTLVPEADRWDYDVPECDPNAVPAYALMTITYADGITELVPPEAVLGTDPINLGTKEFFKVQVFYTNGEFYTQSLKLLVTDDDNDCDTYWVTEFYIYDEAGKMIKAAPYQGDPTATPDPIPPSEFFQFVTQPLPVKVDVCAFKKLEVYIDVLCFAPDYYQLFGFFWFEITEITIREICFFGDICIEWFSCPADGGAKLPWWSDVTTNSNFYQLQRTPNGAEMDMPAICRLELRKDGITQPVGVWDNKLDESGAPWYGVGAPLCFRYADYDNIVGEIFYVDLYLYGPFNNCGFIWGNPDGTPNYTWQFTDDALLAPNIVNGINEGGLDTNADGIVEFAWGNCVENPEYRLTR